MTSTSKLPFLISQRPPFFRFVWLLYTTHDAFRALVDIAVLGAIVVMFIAPPSLQPLQRLLVWIASEGEYFFTQQKARLAPNPPQQSVAVTKTPKSRSSEAPAGASDVSPLVQLGPSNERQTAGPIGASASPDMKVPTPPRTEAQPSGPPAQAAAAPDRVAQLPISTKTPETGTSKTPSNINQVSRTGPPVPSPSNEQQAAATTGTPITSNTLAPMPLMDEVKRPRIVASPVHIFRGGEFEFITPGKSPTAR